MEIEFNIQILCFSGFMGKVLIEKLLYSCPDINRIFILLRPKKGKSTAERLEQLTKYPVN